MNPCSSGYNLIILYVFWQGFSQLLFLCRLPSTCKEQMNLSIDESKGLSGRKTNDVRKARRRAVTGERACCCYQTPPEALVELCGAPQGGSPADVWPSS